MMRFEGQILGKIGNTNCVKQTVGGKETDILRGIETNPGHRVPCSSYFIPPAPHTSVTHHNTMIRDAKHKHKSAWLLLLLIVVQMVTWVTAASGRPYAYTSQAQTPQPLHGRRREDVGVIRREAEGKVLADGLDEINRLGSRPPSCQVKCGGCKPCEAAQVPTPMNHVGVQQQYTNYEPEGWKCRCGSVFFNP